MTVGNSLSLSLSEGVSIITETGDLTEQQIYSGTGWQPGLKSKQTEYALLTLPSLPVTAEDLQALQEKFTCRMYAEWKSMLIIYIFIY